MYSKEGNVDCMSAGAGCLHHNHEKLRIILNLGN